MLNHPAKLEGREVSRDRETGELLEELNARCTMLVVTGRCLDAIVLELLLEERDEVLGT